MTTTSAPTSQAADYDEIVRVVQLYIDGFRTGDTTLFEEAFHDDAWIFYTEADGTLVKSATRDCYQEWASSPEPRHRGPDHHGDAGWRHRQRAPRLG